MHRRTPKRRDAMRYHRKTAPGVSSGRVRKKNNWRGEPDYTLTHQVRVEREPAPRGFRHYVSPTDIHAFLGLLPEWRELSIGLQRVVLSRRTDCLGWCRPGGGRGLRVGAEAAAVVASG